MRVLLYNDLDTRAIPGFAKLRATLEADNFVSADVRKVGDNLFRARLNRSDRLLFSLYRHSGETCCLILEYIRNHAYDRSRFLAADVRIDEDRIPAVESPEAAQPPTLVYLNPERERFNLQDKILSFDEDQHAVHELAPPVIIIGSAGSGKTALTLEKMKQAIGDVLYVSLSPYLVQNARSLYFASNYRNDDQAIDFFSYPEFLESIQVPAGREVTLRDFQQWFQRQRVGRGLRDAHKVYEEFRGVITGPVTQAPWLAREDYLALGIKQSIFDEHERPAVYDLFEKYLAFLEQDRLFDPNITSHGHLALVEPRYDFIVVDEVQDLTNIQLYLILQSLRSGGDFILCGDSNQIVHPNFFSWSNVKSLFFKEQNLTGDGAAMRVLYSNYRNSSVVTEAANRILKLKHARFGSVDRESNYLVRCAGQETGRLQLLEDNEAVKQQLDRSTARSTRVAVLVMHTEQKEEARRWFNTPLVFSVQEAKGLEYDGIILYGFVAGAEKAFREVAAGVDPEALEREELTYARAKDKHDKSLEIYKFYINALYVAITRAVRNIHLVEGDHGHPLLKLLQFDRFTGEVAMETEESSLEEWQREASRLESQGKEEQARDIRDRILNEQAVPWTVLDRDGFAELQERALAGNDKKARLEATEYAWLHHHRPTLNELAEQGFRPARQPEDKARAQIVQNHFPGYDTNNATLALKAADKYGVDHRTRFNLTPLMVAAQIGNPTLAQRLLDRGADPGLRANNGFTALHFALEQAIRDKRFAQQRMARLYPLLEPQSLSVQTGGRLVKLDQRLMESFLLHLMSAMFYRHLGPTPAGETFTAGDLERWVAELPDSVLAARRKRRQYISSVLAKNEINREDRYNRRLFVRVRRGHYVVNPRLRLRDGTEWVAYYDLYPLQDLDIKRAEERFGPQRANDPLALDFSRFDRMQRLTLESLRTTIREHADSAPTAHDAGSGA
ncbi:MAG: ankyrin repeat domain-containing protein [Chromatocurvus sp.]